MEEEMEEAEEEEEKEEEEKTMEEKALSQLWLIFDAIDTSNNGRVEKVELSAALKQDQNLGALLKEAGLNDIFFVLNQLDANQDHRVSWNEFKTHLQRAAVKEVAEAGHIIAAERLAEEKALEELKAIFKSLDADEDGAVSKAELAAHLPGKDASEEGLGKLIQQAGFNSDWDILEKLDTNKEGRVTWDEFEAHLHKAVIEVVIDHMASQQCCGCCFGPL